MNTSNRIKWPNFASVEIPDGWEVSEEGETISIHKDSGVGALQISFAKRRLPGAPSYKEALALTADFAKQRGVDIDENLVSLSDFAGGPASDAAFVETSKGGKDSWWRLWHFVSPKMVCFASYTCDYGDREKEKLEIDSIVRSFEWDRERHN